MMQQYSNKAIEKKAFLKVAIDTGKIPA